MTDFITRIVTPGAAPFPQDELQEQAKAVASTREGYSGVVNGASLMLHETRYACMLLHNRLCEVECQLRAGPDPRYFSPNTR